MLEPAVWELDEREAEEQEILEGVRRSRLESLAWADIVRLVIGDYLFCSCARKCVGKTRSNVMHLKDE